MLNCSKHPQKTECMQNVSKEYILLRSLKEIPPKQFPTPFFFFVTLIQYYSGLSIVYTDTFLLGLHDSITLSCTWYCHNLGHLASPPQATQLKRQTSRVNSWCPQVSLETPSSSSLQNVNQTRCTELVGEQIRVTWSNTIIIFLAHCHLSCSIHPMILHFCKALYCSTLPIFRHYY